MTPKTLVFLHPHLMKSGGASKVVLEQASRLAKKGFDCLVITTKANLAVTNDYPLVKIKQLSERITGDPMFWFNFFRFYRNLENELKPMKNKVLFCHSLAIYWGWIYKLFNPKAITIYYLHDLGLPYTDSEAEISSLAAFPKLVLNLLKPLLHLVNKGVIASANYIIANSETSADFIYNKYMRQSDAVVKPGVDVSVFKPSAIKKNQIITVGRLDKIKNTDTIIKAFSIFTRLHTECETCLVIVGDGHEKNNLQHLCEESGIKDKVIFAGQLPMTELPKYYSESKLSLALCPLESFGLSAAESICCGTPVIGINNNGIKEIIQNHKTGELVENDPNLIATVIYKYLSNKNMLIKITRNIDDKVRAAFDWTTQINKLANVLLPILN